MTFWIALAHLCIERERLAVVSCALDYYILAGKTQIPFNIDSESVLYRTSFSGTVDWAVLGAAGEEVLEVEVELASED